MTFSVTSYIPQWLQQPHDAHGMVAFMTVSLMLAWCIHHAWHWWTRRLAWIAQVNQISGPPMKDAHVLLMHVRDLLQRTGDIPGHPQTPYTFPILKDWCTTYAPHGIVRLWAFNPYCIPFARSVVHLLDPALIREFLTQYDKEPYVSKVQHVYRLAHPLIGNSFLSLPTNAAWKHQRKRTAAAFHSHMLDYATRTVTRLLHTRVFPQWNQQSTHNNNNATCVDMVPLCSRLTLEVLGQVAFSHSFGSLEDVDSDSNTNETSLYTLYQFMLNELTQRMLEPPYAYYLRFRDALRFHQCSQRLDATIRTVIAQRQEQQQQQQSAHDNNNNSPTQSSSGTTMESTAAKNSPTSPSSFPNDILSYLLQPDDDGQCLSPEVIFGNVRMLLFAGHDTTGATLAFALWELAQHPHVQKQLQEELDLLFTDVVSKDPTSFPTYHQIRQLPYLNGVVMETLRMHPAAAVGRSILSDIRLQPEGGDRPAIVIPRGTDLYAVPLMLHHDPALCPQPEHFAPERFIPSSKTATSAPSLVHTHATHKDTTTTSSSSNSNKDTPALTPPTLYYPFSIGPRHCVGHPLATCELKVALAHIVYTYTLQPAPQAVEPVLIMTATNKPHSACIQVTRRHRRIPTK
jgi:cytochrome P450